VHPFASLICPYLATHPAAKNKTWHYGWFQYSR